MCRIKSFIAEKYVIWFVSIMIILCLPFENTACAKENEYYTSFSFEGDEADYREFIHLLLAKLVYDDLAGFEGKVIADYVNSTAAYDQEIWAGSSITFKNLYSYFAGDFYIEKIFDMNSESGLYAVAFFRDKDLILSFRGSDAIYKSFILDESNDWVNTDLRFALQNELSSQFDSVDFCLDYIKDHYDIENKQYNYTFSGHSLGGALVAYASIKSGYYGYSFDGAIGHVIDLIYSDKYLEIDSYYGVDKQNFCNYTDAPGIRLQI